MARIYPRFFEEVSVDAGVRSKFGSNPVRLYLFGQAPLNSPHVYAVWQVVSGLPNRGLSCPTGSDSWTLQVDVYGKQAGDVRDAASALVDAVEATPFGLVQRFSGESRDPGDGSYRYSFDVSWWQVRG